LYPFAQTSAVRALNDPRPWIAERYGDRDGWVKRLERSAARFDKRHVLPEDAETLIKAARKSWDVLETI
jgi:hypothetical protein